MTNESVESIVALAVALFFFAWTAFIALSSYKAGYRAGDAARLRDVIRRGRG